MVWSARHVPWMWMASPVLLAAIAAFRAFASPAALAQVTSMAAALAAPHAARINSEQRETGLFPFGMRFLEGFILAPRLSDSAIDWQCENLGETHPGRRHSGSGHPRSARTSGFWRRPAYSHR